MPAIGRHRSVALPIEESTHEADLLLGDPVPVAWVDLRRHLRPEALQHGLGLPHAGERDVRVAFAATQERGHSVEPGCVIEALRPVAVKVFARGTVRLARAEEARSCPVVFPTRFGTYRNR